MFNFWRSAGLVNGLKPHLLPLSNQKNEMLIFGLHSTSDDWPGWSMDSNPICHPSPAKKIKWPFFWIPFQLLMIGQVGRWTQTPSVTPLQPKNEMLVFGLCSTSDDLLGWSMDSNPIHHPSPAKRSEMLIFGLLSISGDQPVLVNGLKPHPPPLSNQKMKCSFLDYVQLLMIGQARTWTPSTSEWYAHFCIKFQAGQPNLSGLQPHLPPLSNQKNEMLIFVLCSNSDDQPGWSMDSFLNVQLHDWPGLPPHLQPKKWNACFWIMFNFWWSARLVDGLKPHLLPLSSQKKWNCLFLDYVQLLMIGQAGQWTQTPSATIPLQPKKWNACFWIMFNFWWLARLVDGLKLHLLPLSNQKNEMLVFGLCSTSDDWPGWSMDSNPICNPSPTKKMKCLFLDYVQLLMIGQASQWMQIPFGSPLQPKKWKSHFWIMFNFWWSAGLVNGLKPHLPPLSNQKNEILAFVLRSTSDDGLGCLMDSNPICQLSPAK